MTEELCVLVNTWAAAKRVARQVRRECEIAKHHVSLCGVSNGRVAVEVSQFYAGQMVTREISASLMAAARKHDGV